MSPWKCLFGFKLPQVPFPGCLSHADRILVRFQIFLFWKIWPVFVNGGNRCGAAPVSPPCLVSPYSYCWPITASRGFCAKRFSSNFCITSAHSSTVHALPIEIWSTWKVQRAWKSQNDRPPPEFHTRTGKICRFPREFVTLKVAEFVIKIAHFSSPPSCYTKIEMRTVSVKRLYSVTGSQLMRVGHEYALTELLRTSSLSITGSKSLYFKLILHCSLTTSCMFSSHQ